MIGAIAFLVASLWGAQSPDLPGIDYRELGTSWGDTVTRVNKSYSPEKDARRIGGWQAASGPEQMEADEVLLGLGEGAIFVPSMTQGRLEPRVTVLDGAGHVVALGPSGRRLRVPPGSYRVMFGSGAQDQRLTVPVVVVEGETVLTPTPWAGISISTISPERQHLRGEYKLIRQDKFQAYGEGFGQTEERLSDLTTWILPPGVYKITGLAAGADELTNFVTVRLLPGEWIDFTLVMDDSKVVGGGMLAQIPRDNLAQDWRFGADLGGSLAWTREKLSSQANLRTTTNITGFTQLRARKESDDWLTSVGIQFVGGATNAAKANWRVSPDEITSQVFTVWRMTPRLGPYGRLIGTSHVFPTDLDLTSVNEPLRLYVRNPRTGKLERVAPGGSSWESAHTFAPLELRQGLGLNIEAVQWPDLELSLQGGLASRQVFPFRSHFQKSLENPVLQAELRELDSTANLVNTIVMEQGQFEHGTGVEATGELRARLGSSASLTASPGVFWSMWPRSQLEFSATSVLSLHFTSFVSMDLRYTVKKSLDEDAIHRYPYSLQALLRFSFGS